MNNKDIENILNDISHSIFKSPVEVNFRINETEQIVLSVRGITHLYHLKDRVTKKVNSKKLIDAIIKKPNEAKSIGLIIDFLKDITGTTTNWSEYINRNVDIDEEIVEKAKKVLREHIDSVKEIYLIPIKEKIDSLNVDKPTLNKIWKEHIIPEYTVIEKIDSFRSYATIKKVEEYPYLILSSKTGRVLLTKETSGHFLKVENIEEELSKVKETERIIDEYTDNIKPFLIVEEYIDRNRIKYTSMIKDSSELKEYGSMFDHEYFYSNRISSEIEISLVEGTLRLKDKKHSLKDAVRDIGLVQNEIDKIFELEFNEVLEILKDKVKARKEKFNKPYMMDILNLLCDFPQKGVTTYVSILAGERNYKISNNDYDKSSSYGKMSECKKPLLLTR